MDGPQSYRKGMEKRIYEWCWPRWCFFQWIGQSQIKIFEKGFTILDATRKRHVVSVTYVQSVIRVWLFVAPQTIAHQPPSVPGIVRHEYRSGLLFPSPGDLLDPGIEPMSLVSPALAGGFFITVPHGKPLVIHGKSSQEWDTTSDFQCHFHRGLEEVESNPHVRLWGRLQIWWK